MKWLLIAASLLLGGCAEVAATAIIDARDLHERARTYLGDIYDMREETRRQCREIINRHVDALVAEGRTLDALDFLASYYPPLTSLAAVKAAVEKDASFVNRAVGCERYDTGDISTVKAQDSLPTKPPAPVLSSVSIVSVPYLDNPGQRP